jgi:hypothetical protein
MQNSFSAYSLSFSPLLAENALWLALIAFIVLAVLSLFLHRRGLLPRTIIMAIFAFLFLNPGLIEQQRIPVKDVVVIIKDISPSQNIGNRTEQANEALAQLESYIAEQQSLSLRVIDAPSLTDENINETHLFTALDSILADVPESRRAGVIFLTDGQIHDVPQNKEKLREYGPLHVLLTGTKNENDRRLVIMNAPAYGLVGQEAEITFKVEGSKSRNPDDDYASLIIRENNQPARLALVPLNEEQSITVKIDRAGQNIIELETEPVENELTAANNRTPVIINGVRDRLKVLLVSGQPHAGGRTWRNIMTADPGVDLVHFTILREPDKLDFTPQNELSLIAFPFRELFEVKLYDFDLIIFDRYKLNRILPLNYFENIARYVREGGALLEVSGPSYASDNSLFTTALRDILPAYPAGEVANKEFTPALTDIGKIHPVTAKLPSSSSTENPWGSWFRQVDVYANQGDVLMNGADDMPLLVLNRVGKGRVAQFSSDQIWLWARQYQNGGPQAELLRRLIHWLMKEPQLEENALETRVNGNNIEITRRTLSKDPVRVKINTPENERDEIELTPHADGVLKGSYAAQSPGIYKMTDELQSRFVIVGDAAPPELMNIHATEDKMKSATQISKGGIKWLDEDPNIYPRILSTRRNNYDLQNGIGLRGNQSFEIKGVQEKPLLPAWALLILSMVMLLGGWALESRRQKRT